MQLFTYFLFLISWNNKFSIFFNNGQVKVNKETNTGEMLTGGERNW